MTLHQYLFFTCTALILGTICFKLLAGEVKVWTLLFVAACAAIPYMNFGVTVVCSTAILFYGGWLIGAWVTTKHSDLLDKKLF